MRCMLERRDGNIPINLEMLHDNIPPQVYFRIFLKFCVSYKKSFEREQTPATSVPAHPNSFDAPNDLTYQQRTGLVVQR